MFYTKLVISESVEQSFVTIMTTRWALVPANTSGGTKAYRLATSNEWILNPSYADYNSVDSKSVWEEKLKDGPGKHGFPDGTTYYESVRGWDSAVVAQEWVTAVQALNLAGVTVSYEGDTDPTAV